MENRKYYLYLVDLGDDVKNWEVVDKKTEAVILSVPEDELDENLEFLQELYEFHVPEIIKIRNLESILDLLYELRKTLKGKEKLAETLEV